VVPWGRPVGKRLAGPSFERMTMILQSVVMREKVVKGWTRHRHGPVVKEKIRKFLDTGNTMYLMGTRYEVTEKEVKMLIGKL
jgi:hypothetical protein